MKYKFQIYEIHLDGTKLRVVEGEANTEEEAERECYHYALQYAQDYPIEIKKNWRGE